MHRSKKHQKVGQSDLLYGSPLPSKTKWAFSSQLNS